MSSPRIKIGYSCWGFLGDGITDTPDGGRSHRITLIRSLIDDQHASIYMLQQNRDLNEAGETTLIDHVQFVDDLPEVDFVFLEYRWPIQGRNTGVEKADPHYTPDLDRQQEIICHYAAKGVPILVWDKDQQLDTLPPELSGPKVHIFEPSLHPKFHRTSLLFPADSVRLDKALSGLDNYSRATRSRKLVYVGNQYDRDESFKKYYIQAAEAGVHLDVFGKWSSDAFMSIASSFHGRIAYADVQSIYADSFCHVVIAPDRYYKNGQYTQRVFESIWAGCIPLVPLGYALKELIYPELLWVRDGKEVAEKITQLQQLTDKELVDIMRTIIVNLKKYFLPVQQSSTILKAYRALL